MEILNTLKSIVKNWWLFLIIGIALVGLGIVVFRHPLASYIGLSIFFIITLFITGVSQIIYSISNRANLPSWGWHLAGGVFETIIGLFLMIHPGMSMALLPVVVGFWLMFKGISLIGLATDVKALGFRRWAWLLAGGILTTVLAFFITIDPLIGPISIVVFTGLAAIISGSAHIYFAIQLNKIRKEALSLSPAS